MRRWLGIKPGAGPSAQQRARSLADRLDLAVLLRREDAEAGDVVLQVPDRPEEGLALDWIGEPGKPVTLKLNLIDVTSPAGRSLRQPLARALGIRDRKTPPPRVLDATAGFGHDTWLMLGQGCRVLAVERDPLVAAVLRDALDQVGESGAELAQRVHVRCADTAEVLRTIASRDEKLEIVFLDPMFPPGRRTVERKPLRLLRHLVGDDEFGPAWLPLALAAASRRVVVKRPVHAPPLADHPAPDFSHVGRAVRYDVYAIKQRSFAPSGA